MSGSVDTTDRFVAPHLPALESWPASSSRVRAFGGGEKAIPREFFSAPIR